MVENIFGRKSYPQSKYQERSFLQTSAFALHHRRVSGEPINLRTIAETADDEGCDLPSLAPSKHSDWGASGSSEQKQHRAISLPTIYRDGSYLRINFPVQYNEGTGKRRFSEPAVSWSSKFRPAIVPMSNDKKSSNDRVTHFRLAKKFPLFSGGVTFPKKNQIEKRRHSDPLIYTASDTTKKIENSASECQKIEKLKQSNGVGNLSTSCTENISGEADKSESQRPEQDVSTKVPRRRKSSLVPIPFSIVKNCSSRKDKTPSKRRLSFPLSKNEEELTKNLPALHKQAWIGDSEDQHGSSNESMMPLDLLIQEDSSDEMDDNTVEKNSCEEIITQWMKFFG